MSKSNNFPRKGKHSTVTKEAVRQLERERPTHNAERHYTIGGDVEATVHSNLQAEREAAITHGHRRLNAASAKARAGFVAAKPSMRTEYIRAQRVAANQHPARNIARQKGPCR